MRYIVVPLRALDAEAAPQAPPRPSEGTGVLHAVPSPPDARAEGPQHARRPEPPSDPLGHWVAVARACLDACLVLDAVGSVLAVSPTAAELLGTPQEAFVGRALEEALFLVDFTDVANEARGLERRIPPLIALRENSLSRGVMRVRRPDGHRLMLDAVAAPIHDGGPKPVGAVSFLASV